jgi:hypothetical protein
MIAPKTYALLHKERYLPQLSVEKKQKTYSIQMPKSASHKATPFASISKNKQTEALHFEKTAIRFHHQKHAGRKWSSFLH